MTTALERKQAADKAFIQLSKNLFRAWRTYRQAAIRSRGTDAHPRDLAIWALLNLAAHLSKDDPEGSLPGFIFTAADAYIRVERERDDEVRREAS